MESYICTVYGEVCCISDRQLVPACYKSARKTWILNTVKDQAKISTDNLFPTIKSSGQCLIRLAFTISLARFSTLEDRNSRKQFVFTLLELLIETTKLQPYSYIMYIKQRMKPSHMRAALPQSDPFRPSIDSWISLIRRPQRRHRSRDFFVFGQDIRNRAHRGNALPRKQVTLAFASQMAPTLP